MSNIFYSKFSEVSGDRLDPTYYANLGLYKGLDRLKTIVKVKGGKRIPKGKTFSNETTKYKYLRVEDIDAFGNINISKLKNISKEIYEELKRYKLNENEIVISNAGTIGKVTMLEKFDEKIILTENCVKLVIHDNQILPKFLETMVRSNFIQTQFQNNYIKTTIPKLSVERISNTFFPKIPSFEIQNKIVSKMEQAHHQKRQKEQEAQKKLESIDAYLLDALGIELPTEREESLEDRVFVRRFSEVSGKRNDAYYFKQNFITLLETVKKSKYKIETFGQLIKDLKNGIEVRKYIENDGMRYLRVTDLGKNGINNKSPRFVAKQEIPKRIKLNSNCILISRSGSLGLVNVVEKSIENAILSSHIFKVELKSNILPLYIEAYLRSTIGQTEIFRNNNGGVIPEINQTALKSIFIVLPPLEEQTKIANHIQKLREEAQALKKEATEIYNSAKLEVEKMILGKIND